MHLTNSAIEDQVISYVNSWSVGLGPPRKGIRGFHPGIYSDANHLKKIGINPFSHYISSGMPVGIWNYKVISSENQRDKIYLPADGNVALHIHVFYVEIFHDIILRILENKIRPDIFITVTNSKEIEIIEKLLVDNKLNVTSIDLVDNIGRNIKPLIDIYNNKIKGKYKYFGHIHTKKSPYDGHEMGAAWGNSILNNLLGNKKAPMLDLILNEMEIENKIGIVVPEDPNIVGWDKNLEAAKKILNDLEIKEELPINFNFPIGAMFIARDVAIKFINNPKLKNLDYPKEPVPRDGTVLHAIERLMGFTNEPFVLSAAYLEGTKR
jgi:lipopolysaccharide biosynthesis protein